MFSLESGAIAPSAPSQLRHWYIKTKQSRFMTLNLRNKV